MEERVLLIGGTGFVGTSLSKSLGNQGFHHYVPTRNNAQIPIIEQNLLAKGIYVNEYTSASLNELFKTLTPKDVVNNLVGVLHSSHGVPYGSEFAKAHVELPKMIMAAMKQNGLRRYIHMSALGADVNGPSMYLRSKGAAEELVKSCGLDWTIFRPSVIFGSQDKFINMFGQLLKYAPFMPLAGAQQLFQPVAVKNVTESFIAAISMPQTIHQSYDLAGPKVLSLRQIVEFAAKKKGLRRSILPLPQWIGYLQALFLEKLPGPTIMSRDNFYSMKVPNILPLEQPNAIQEVFGMEPLPLESLLK